MKEYEINGKLVQTEEDGRVVNLSDKEMKELTKNMPIVYETKD